MESEKVAPVALFAFRRPEHLTATLHALACNRQAVYTRVVAFVDAPRDPSDEPLVEEVSRILEIFSASGAFKALDVHRAVEPKGLARSVIEGLSLVMTDHDRVIGLEDDIVLAPTGLAFLNAALDAYQNDPRVWSVSAFSPPLQMPYGYADQTYFAGRASSWGYATWRDRWQEMSWDNDHFQLLASNPQFRRRFARGGNDLPPMLDKQLAGTIDSWAVRWCARQAEIGSLTVYPTKSLVVNIGMDGSGTHSPRLNTAGATPGSWDASDRSFGEPRLNAKVSRRFRNFYVSRIRLFASHVGGVLKDMRARLRRP